MPDASSGGIVSEQELALLKDLFLRFEGAGDPFSVDCRDAKWQFYAILRDIYVNRVRPKFTDIDFSIFCSMTRRRCRDRLSREGAPFPCPQPPTPVSPN
jgi:hypothetical protein